MPPKRKPPLSEAFCNDRVAELKKVELVGNRYTVSALDQFDCWYCKESYKLTTMSSHWSVCVVKAMLDGMSYKDAVARLVSARKNAIVS
jgi:hypothetical protein